MRLSEDKARRLNALVWRERARRVLPVIAVAIGAIALLTFFLVRQVEKADRTLDVQVHQGHGRPCQEVRQRSRRRDCRGPSRRRAQCGGFSALRVDPATGTHVIVNEARHSWGA